MSKLTSKENVKKIKEKLLNRYPDIESELNFNNEYELLVNIILSAQCTDKRVNIITPPLFKKYPSTKELSEAELEDVKDFIKSCSFFNNKAKHIIKMAIEVRDKFNNKIPHKKSELIKLAGVGNKTANVFLIETENANLMAVDTHVFRVSHRLGLSNGKSVKKTEEDLVEKFEDNLDKLHQGMVFFGRYICKAINPDCDKCIFPELCKTKESFKA